MVFQGGSDQGDLGVSLSHREAGSCLGDSSYPCTPRETSWVNRIGQPRSARAQLRLLSRHRVLS